MSWCVSRVHVLWARFFVFRVCGLGLLAQVETGWSSGIFLCAYVGDSVSYLTPQISEGGVQVLADAARYFVKSE